MTCSIPQAVQIAAQYIEVGNFTEAEALLRRILEQEDGNADAWHLLGIVAHGFGRNDVALQILGKAIFLDPISPHYRNTQGLVRQSLGDLDEAIGEFHCALKIEPRLAQARNNLANALRAQDRTNEAIAEYRLALTHAPDYLEARNNLGNALKELGQLESAADEYKTVIVSQPGNPAVHYNLALCQVDLGQWAAAAASFRVALALNPNFAMAHLHLANVLRKIGRLDDAAAEYRALIALVSQSVATLQSSQATESSAQEMSAQLRLLADAYGGLGNALQESGNTQESIEAHRAALAIDPAFAEAHNNIANALKDAADMDGATVEYRQAVALKPEDASMHSNLVYALQFSIEADAASLAQEQHLWSERHAAPLAEAIQEPGNDRDPQRRLKIGYVSSCFWKQAECYFVLPLLQAHDRAKVEIHCYADTWRSDKVTDKFRRVADHWNETLGLSDAALAECIRADGIDILVDLSMHMRHNRMLVFARKPAPIQVSWLAYPGSTGLSTIDYRLTDECMEPAGSEESAGQEKALRLSGGWCCYESVGGAPDVAALPALKNGYVTFGSLNNPCKMNSAVLKRWAETLLAVGNSRLLLLCPEGAARDRVLATLQGHGLAADRVEFTGQKSREEYLRLYARIDIALDPFPYNGITTTCDALWMGVPVLTIPGLLPHSRAGLSLLTTAGLADELVANSESEHIALAKHLAADLPRLAQMRASLREKVAASPLMDAARFARAMEDACRTTWKKWCGVPSA